MSFVEDDEVLALLLQRTFVKGGYEVKVMHDAPGVTALVRGETFDALIIDGNLPTGDGFELCRQLRPHFAGIIMPLTGRDDDDELMGLELGADDYIPQTGRTALSARARESASTPAAKSIDAPMGAMTFGEIEIDIERRERETCGSLLVLTDAEFDLLAALTSRAAKYRRSRHPFQVHAAWNTMGRDRSIDMRVSRLRKLLGDDPTQPWRIIKTVRGRGYLFAR